GWTRRTAPAGADGSRGQTRRRGRAVAGPTPAVRGYWDARRLGAEFLTRGCHRPCRLLLQTWRIDATRLAILNARDCWTSSNSRSTFCILRAADSGTMLTGGSASRLTGLLRNSINGAATS